MEARGKPLKTQVKEAYADKHRGMDRSKRDLDFITDKPVMISEAAPLIRAVRQYNNHDPEITIDKLKVVEMIDDETLVWVGREGSPVIYLQTKNPVMVQRVFSRYADRMSVVSRDNVPNSMTDSLFQVVRLWWD